MAPVVAVGAAEGVAEAASQIERHGLVFVVDAERRPIGVMGAPELRLALRAETEDVVALTRRGVAQVPADAPLEAAYRMCAAGQPVAVVDVEGRLVGSLAWADVLGSLAKDDLPSGRPPGA
jgi:CBS-domain-containing membrane protein